MSQSSTERHALVTGASRGIGRAIAITLARMGYAVTVNYLSNAEAAQETLALIQSEGGKAHALQADVSNPDDIARLVDAARQAFGPVAILVNNAGIGHRVSVFDNPIKDFDATFAANVESAFLMTQAVLPDMMGLNFGRLIFLCRPPPRGLAASFRPLTPPRKRPLSA